MTVKPLTINELALARDIEAVCFSDPWSESLWQRYLPDTLGLFEQGHLLGYTQCASVLDEAELLRIAVIPEHRGKGLGYCLLSKLFDELQQRDIQRVMLEVRESNFAAIALYQRCGFVLDGRRKGYYPVEHSDQFEDALLMSKPLNFCHEQVT